MSQHKRNPTRDTFIRNRDESDGTCLYTSSFENIYKVKVVIIGDMGVGKTSIAARYVKGSFNSQYITTVGGSFLCKEVKMPNYTIVFQIWDTAGQERFRSLIPMYLRGANAALLVYDVTNEDSFRIASKWLKEIYCHCPEDTTTMLIAAKCDLPSAVDIKTAKEFAARNRMLFMETSSKTGFNVDKIFTQLASELTVTEDQNRASVLELSDSPFQSLKSKRCCSS